MLGAATVASILLVAALVPEAHGRHLKAMNFEASILSVCTFEADVDYPGNDISNVVAPQDQCCDRCKSVNGCNAWTWTSQSGGTCYFKSRVGDRVAKPGAASSSVQPSGNECSYPLETNIDFPGNDIGNKPSNNPGDCCKICKEFSGCKAYSWTNQSGGTCYLKSLTGERVNKLGVISAVVEQNPDQCNALQEQNTDFPGNDIGNKPSDNPGGCCSICKNFTGCRAYSWTNQNGGTCYLKSATGQKTSKQGVTSATVVPNPQCNANQEPNTDFPGNDIGNKPSNNAGGCCDICKATDGCRAYSWTNQSGGTCYLKSLTGSKVAKDGVISATVVPNPEQCTAAIESNVDFVGFDIGNKPSSTAEGCCAICKNTNDCRAYSWTNQNGGTCYLKSISGERVAKQGVTSAVVTANPEPPCQVEDGVDYVNNDIANVRAANAKDCCYICKGRASSGCKAFSWNDYQGGTCWLKSGKGTTAQKAGVKSATA